jgi:ABC-type antimicrobial peptide transport system permease subunit
MEVTADAGASPLLTDRNIVAPGYFRTLGIPLLAGRDFELSDRQGARAVAIVSQSLAERLWPGQDPLGRRILTPQPAEIVGVAADTRYRNVLDAPKPLLYSPLTQNYDSIARLMVALNTLPPDFKETLRRAVQQANPDLPAAAVTTLREQIEHSVWERRAVASLLSFFGVLAIALACAGVYGVVSYATAQQTRDIAIRMALGADRSRVLTQVLVRTMRRPLQAERRARRRPFAPIGPQPAHRRGPVEADRNASCSALIIFLCDRKYAGLVSVMDTTV